MSSDDSRDITAARLAGFLILLFLLLATGCASTSTRRFSNREFLLGRDSFAYANELLWIYELDPESGNMDIHSRETKPEYHNHCFVMTRAARQFFDFARFDSTAPKVDESTYRSLVKEVVAREPRSDPSKEPRVIIPGYEDLFTFSRDHEAMLKEECGGQWRSYVQRGHWRMLFPFGGGHQEKLAARLRDELSQGLVPILHLVRFPQLTINHSVLLYDVVESEEGLHFLCYDPNQPDEPLEMDYRSDTRRFETNPSFYYRGGRVDVYEVYRNWLY